MKAEKQKYCPVQNYPAAPIDEVRLGGTKPFKAARLPQGQHTETPRMRNAKIKTVNPVTPGDRSMAKGRVYEKGRKNQTRT